MQPVAVNWAGWVQSGRPRPGAYLGGGLGRQPLPLGRQDCKIA